MTKTIDNIDSSFEAVEDALRRNARMYFDVVTQLVVALDKNGVVVFINKKGVDMLGYPQEDIVGKNWFEHFIPREDEEEIRRMFDAMREGRSATVEYYQNDILAKNGEKKLISFHNVPVKDSGGSVIGILSSGDDITEKNRLNAALVKQENLNEVVSDNLPIGYCINTISDGKVVFMNKKFEDIYGWPRTILTDVDSFFEHVYPDPAFRGKLKEQVMMDIMSADPVRMIWKSLPIMRQSGEVAYITAQNIPLYEYDFMISTVMDVSYQVKIEKSLRENQRIQLAILDNISDLALVKSKDGVVLLVNEVFAKAIRKSLDYIIGKTDYDLWEDKSIAEAFRADDAEVITVGKQVRKKGYIPIPGTSEKIFVEITRSPIYNDDGSIFGVTHIAHVIEPTA